MNEDMVDKLILEGVIEVAGIDSETSEFLYTFTPKLKDKYPLLYDELQNHISKEIMELWQFGFVSMDVMAENPIVSLTEKAFITEEVEKLGQQLQHSLSELKRLTAID